MNTGAVSAGFQPRVPVAAQALSPVAAKLPLKPATESGKLSTHRRPSDAACNYAPHTEYASAI